MPPSCTLLLKCLPIKKQKNNSFNFFIISHFLLKLIFLFSHSPSIHVYIKSFPEEIWNRVTQYWKQEEEQEWGGEVWDRGLAQLSVALSLHKEPQLSTQKSNSN